GLPQAGIIESHADQPLRAVGQSPFQDRSKQLLRFPLAARVKEILRAPTAVLAAVSPNNARQAATAEADQRTQCLAHGAMKRALLRKYAAPVPCNVEELG